MISYLAFAGWLDQESILSVLPKEIMSYIFSLAKSREYIEAQCKALGFTKTVSKEYYCHQIYVLHNFSHRRDISISNLTREQLSCVKTLCRINSVKYTVIDANRRFRGEKSALVNVRLYM